MDSIVERARSGTPSTAHLDSAHTGDIVGALGTIRRDAPRPKTRRAQLAALLAVMGPGLVVMVADNDAGGVSTYAQSGQNYGMGLLWTLLLLIPVLALNQEMVVRLGLVTGVGHAKLIFARFGRFWGAFSFADLMVLNYLTIVVDFIGLVLGARYLAISPYIAVPLAIALLSAATLFGSFRSWERAMYLCVAASLLVIPLALLGHTDAHTAADGLLPGFPGGLNSSVLLLVVAIVGTTVAPWQLFFQQSNVIDKRLTPRFMRHERIDLWAGIAVVIFGAAAMMAVTAVAFGHGPLAGHYTDAGATATALGHALGRAAGVLFALVLINAGILGACAVSLASSYAMGDVMGAKHSLHRSWRDAPLFHGSFVLTLLAAGAFTLIPGAPLGAVTTGVQALAGVLLPSAIVFLLLLCNDDEVLGPWTNTTWLNVLGTVVVGVLCELSLILVTTTLFPAVDARVLAVALTGVLAAALTAFGVAALAHRRRGSDRPEPSRADRAVLRAGWQTPPLEQLARPLMSTARRAALLSLRGYLVIAVVAVVVKTTGAAG